MYGAVDFTTILLPRGLPGFIYQRFQRFNHVNLTTCGGAAGAGRSQLPPVWACEAAPGKPVGKPTSALLVKAGRKAFVRQETTGGI